jgi:hypothetical protein
MERGVPKWYFFVCLPVNFSSASPFPYGNYHMESVKPNGNLFSYSDFFLNSQMVTDTRWKRVSDWIVTIWKWGAVNPRFHTGIPIWKRGAKKINPHMETVINRFHMRMCQSPGVHFCMVTDIPRMKTGTNQSPFPYRDPYVNGEPKKSNLYMETVFNHFHMGLC